MFDFICFDHNTFYYSIFRDTEVYADLNFIKYLCGCLLS